MGYLKSFALLALASAGVVGSAKPSANAPGILGLRGTIPLSTEPESYWTTPAPPPANPPQDRPGTPAPPKASSSNFHLDLVVGLGVAFTFLTIIGCAVLRHIHRHTRNGIPAEIQMATITDASNVVEPNLLLGTTQNNVLPHPQQVFNPIPTAPPPDIGIRGVPLNPQIQQPHPGPVASSAPQQQTSNLGQGLHLQLREIRHDTGVGASLVFADTRQQPASENPDNAPQASASSRIPSPSPSNIQSPPRHTDNIPPGPPLQYH